LTLSGKPPYPLVKNLDEDELNYITCWLDYYQFGRSSQDGQVDCGEIIGHHVEFKDQQDKGETEFKLPQISNQ